MVRRPAVGLALLGVLCSLGLAASAFAAPAAPEAPVEPKQVRAWLMRIHEAASQRNFQGTFVVTAGGAVSSARIAHFYDGVSQFERIESLDGQARHVFRHNDQVQTVWPQSRVAMVEQREPLSSFPALLQSDADRIAEFYDVRPQGVDRVAGHEASVLTLRPRDAHRFGYRLWADRATGLLLRADVLGDRGEMLESSAFSDVAIGVRPQPESVLIPMKKLDGFRVVRPTLVATKLELEGWSLGPVVPGFRQVSCVKRPLDVAAEDDLRSPSIQAVHTIFSDGLTYVSVFIEPFSRERHVKPMLTVIGATHTLMRQQGDWWVTVVGDVPAATLRAFASGLERKK